VKRAFRREVEGQFAKQIELDPDSVITEENISGLPESVQRYLRYSKVIGHEKINCARLKQQGFIRMNPDAKWMPIEAEEYYTVDPPALLWHCRAKMMPLLTFEAVDKYVDNTGSMQGKLLSFIKVVDASGIEMDQGAMMRYFNEMFWFPTSYISDNVEWTPKDTNQARGTFSYGGKSVSADFYFDELGRITNFVADRYRSVGDGFVLEKWSTPVHSYEEHGGLILPTAGEAVWQLDAGDFSYIRLKISDVEYNNPMGFWQG
jgi:hypothetical protein